EGLAATAPDGAGPDEREPQMKFSRSIFAVVTFALAATAAGASSDSAAAPDFVLKSVEGPNYRLSEQRGEIVMLAFTASWCGDCRPFLEQVAELAARYGEAGVVPFAVSLDKDRRGAATVADRANVDFPVLHDPRGEVAKSYDVRELPHLVLVDRSGNVRHVFSGYRRGDEDTYLARLRELLREL